MESNPSCLQPQPLTCPLCGTVQLPILVVGVRAFVATDDPVDLEFAERCDGCSELLVLRVLCLICGEPTGSSEPSCPQHANHRGTN
jgi:hypothetical protein